MKLRIWRTYRGITKVREFKKGDKVIYKVSGEEGIVTDPRPDGVRGFVLVQFSPGSDGYCVPVSELIEKA
jgi:hypothetical protein